MCSQTKGKRGSHGFCQTCTDYVEEDPESHDIHQRYVYDRIPNYGGDPLSEYMDLNPFVVCDRNVCAFCDREAGGIDDCCTDHIHQHCSCYPDFY